MSYYLRGPDGEGLGAINAQGGWSPEPVPERPQYEDCGPGDGACIARNLTKNIGWNQAASIALYGHDGSGNGPLGQLDKPFVQTYVTGSDQNPYPSGQAQAPAAATPPVTPSVSGGHVTFTSSRGSNALQVGDTWLVSITGATPNAPVTATVGSSTSPMGTTDSSGNFSLAGTARSQDVGTWNESWSVGGAPSGSFGFTVSAPVAAAAASATPQTAGTSTGSAAGASSSSTVIGGFDLSTIPTWGWLAAAGVAAFFMFGKGGR
jgi:hypothetical protein